ncbi:unnamed protein product [Urochloa humidicola]
MRWNATPQGAAARTSSRACLRRFKKAAYRFIQFTTRGLLSSGSGRPPVIGSRPAIAGNVRATRRRRRHCPARGGGAPACSPRFVHALFAPVHAQLQWDR